MSEKPWPRCPKCFGLADIRSEGSKYFAQCCGGRIRIVVGWMPWDANEEYYLPLHAAAPRRASRIRAVQ